MMPPANPDIAAGQIAPLHTSPDQVVAPETHSRWVARWESEWQQLQGQQMHLAEQKLLFEQHCRSANGEIELSRRQLQDGWQQLRLEKQQWEERRAAEEARLAELGQKLRGESRLLRQAEQMRAIHWEQQEAVNMAQAQEIAGLEVRISNLRKVLAALRAEVIVYEDLICDQPTAAAQEPESGEVRPDPHAASPSSPELGVLQRFAEALIDEQQRIVEQASQVLKLRDAWKLEWDRALVVLEEREAEVRARGEALRPREAALAQQERSLRQRLAEVAGREQELQGWEHMLERTQANVHAQKDRAAALAVLRERTSRSRLRRAVRIHRLARVWVHRERERLQNARLSTETARQEYMTARETLRRKLLELAERERSLGVQELIVKQAQEQLLAQDPRPRDAEAELQRRRRHLDQITQKPLRLLGRRQSELERQAERLEAYRGCLEIEERRLDEQRQELLAGQALLAVERARFEEEKLRQVVQLRWLREDRARLRQQVRELDRQLERLSVQLINAQPVETAVRLAA